MTARSLTSGMEHVFSCFFKSPFVSPPYWDLSGLRKNVNCQVLPHGPLQHGPKKCSSQPSIFLRCPASNGKFFSKFGKKAKMEESRNILGGAPSLFFLMAWRLAWKIRLFETFWYCLYYVIFAKKSVTSACISLWKTVGPDGPGLSELTLGTSQDWEEDDTLRPLQPLSTEAQAVGHFASNLSGPTVGPLCTTGSSWEQWQRQQGVVWWHPCSLKMMKMSIAAMNWQNMLKSTYCLLSTLERNSEASLNTSPNMESQSLWVRRSTV